MDDKPPIWESFSKALGAEYRPVKEIQGASGLTHEVQAIAVDDKGNRVILISADPNSRTAALMRIDVQATMPDAKVLVARPLAVDLAFAARFMFNTETGELDLPKVMQIGAVMAKGDAAQDEMKELLGPGMNSIFGPIQQSDLPIKTHFLNAVEQAASLDWRAIFEGKHGAALDMALEALNQLRSIDNLAGDRKQGICPIPTYEFTEGDWDMLHSGKHIDEVQERLKSLNIFQYFFPPADNLALGLIDKGLSAGDQLRAGFKLAEAQGHLISPNTIVPDAASMTDMIDELQARGFVVSGETEIAIGPEGTTFRQTISHRPAEGLIERLSKIVSFKVDLNLRDLLKPPV
ncbi:MAG: hypothetical protein EOQ86_31000 [Mesorhizobium sp.]|uniref:hypothetical protein n=1 Tax=Mesorhizobium sp. TaxID=1871066 RepID=UPI000FE5D011|nr:hypothetical protein [Mesorhizobium sp.]RWH69658.1 MAG: hypothetical protein EOQ85_32415 [Mesorhizobium sp.]RWH76321.1 MAG: hypothetical protein EOQ86_31000 [Mesorhizobium sp.]RWH83877.1 MAG: hypothetical protein EOQ87_31960 [Mesorhizobium sp.]RWH96641.1 MAG: hypothetical protein EOQ88_19790 [Mesorhizobium sp.]RWI12005.1 MAG: hypothetical protein EOQ91_29940 [Mesorhizobium sp.]